MPRSASTSPRPSPPEASPDTGEPSLDSAPAGFLCFDASGTVRSVNATLAGMVGRSARELVGQHVDQLLPPAARIFFSTHLFPLLRVERIAEEIYLPLRLADGTDVPMLVNGRARQVGGDLVFDLVVVPMRRRNELEDELLGARVAAEQLVAAKDRFLSVVSHELRTPLAAIIGYAELVLRRFDGADVPEAAYVRRIREAAKYQAELIDQILDFTTSGTDRPLSPGVMPMEETLQRTEAILGVRAMEEGRSLERTPQPTSDRVIADARAVQQILLNLGTNSLKYGRRGTPIRIAVEADDQLVRISVADEGEGIPADQIERIFEPFTRLAPSEDASDARGIGLGLTISRDLARAMGGDVTASSIPGAGSTFVLQLPRAAHAPDLSG